MFLHHVEQGHASAALAGCRPVPAGTGRRRLVTPPCDRPLVLLILPEDVARELRADGSPFYFGPCGADPVTGIDRDLRDAVRFAAHPVDLVRRLGEWADRVQAAVPAGQVAACWHPAITPEVLRQASRYPVHVIHGRTAADAHAAAAPLLAESPDVVTV